MNHDAFDEILGYGLKLESRLSLTQTMAILPQMKALTAPAKSAAKRRVSKWIPGGVPDAAISKNEANRFTNGLLKIADRIEGLPPDFAKNHKPYLHSLPKP